MQIIRDRLADKADGQYVLLEYLSELQLDDLARCAFVMAESPHDSDRHIHALDRVQQIRNGAVQEYTDANHDAELAEYLQERRDAAIDAEIDERQAA